QEALRRMPMRTRVEIRRELAEAGELQALIGDSIRSERKEEVAVIQFRCPLTIAQASSYLDQFFSTSVRYLGPLRDEPKSLYPLAPTADPSDVGIKGEHTAAVLDLHKSTQVRYLPTLAFAEAEIKGRPTTRSLEAAVTDWLHYLGVAEGVQTRDRGKFGHELTVSVDGDSGSHDLTHVGVGVSQVLPILVASLLADLDTTLIFEQPELHLHPKVQTLLADFFLSMTALGKQCIVETHSEYLINRVRFRTAAAVEGNPWLARQKMYFVERPSEGSTFREVEINEFGAVVEWPEGFFDQSQKEAEDILRVASKKRKLLRGN
ncbi:MAG: AAA family ATPase, partial [Pyrinomonadaceae bacterium]